MAEYTEKVITTVDPETSVLLNEIAAKHYTSRATIARRALAEWVKQHDTDEN